MAKEKSSTEYVQCNHCGNPRVSMEIVSEHTITHSQDHDRDPRGMYEDFYTKYELIKCPACHEFSLRRSNYHGMMESTDIFPETLYPVQPKSPKGLPPQLLHEYKEAMRARSINANLYGMSIGRVLEFICEDRGAVGKTLAIKLEDLANKDEIPSNLVKVAHNLRLFRNIGAHETSFELTGDDLPILDDLLQAILLYVYTAPSIAKQAEERYDRLRGKSSKDGSDSKAPETS